MECEENLLTNNIEKCKRDRSYCVVSKCGSQGTRNPDLSFFRFPKAQYDENGCITFKGIQNLLRKKDWISVLRLERNISDRAVVCSKHFQDSDFTTTDGSKKRRLKLNAVPSLFLPHENIKQNGYISEITKEWEEEEIASLIALYKMKKCLYDHTDINYSDNGKRSQAYREIQNVMSKMRPGCTIREIMYKISHFRSQYMLERRKREKSVQSGLCTEETFIPKMWNFDLLKFLDNYIKQSGKKELKERGNSQYRDRQCMKGKTVNQFLEVEFKEFKEEIADSVKPRFSKIINLIKHEEQNKESVADIKKYLNAESLDEKKKQLTTTPITIKISHQVVDSMQDMVSTTKEYWKMYNRNSNVELNDRHLSVQEYKPYFIHSIYSRETTLGKNKNEWNDKYSKKDGSEHVLFGDRCEFDEKLNDEPECILSGESQNTDEEFEGNETKKCGKVCNESDDVFGRYIASKMKILRNNAVLQLQTEQAILEVILNACKKMLQRKWSELS